MKLQVLSSPIRWAGSKKKLLNEMIAVFDESKKIYVEPFLGSAVVLLNVIQFDIYDEYYVNDSNENIINFFMTIKDNVDILNIKIEKMIFDFNKLDNFEEKELFYYNRRTQFNGKRINSLTRSAIFWFLMKSGYNGVYRVNSKGEFNVPYGKKDNIIFSKKELERISLSIRNVHFFNMDYSDFFEYVNEHCKINDCFVYCDPPYIADTPAMKNQILYTHKIFSHEKFLEFIENSLFYKKSSIMISMSKSETAKDIYSSYFSNCIKIRDIIRIVNPKKKISSVEEAYLNYLPNIDL